MIRFQLISLWPFLLVTVGLLTVFLIQSGRLKQSINLEIDNFDSKYKDLSPEMKSKADYLFQVEICSIETMNIH